jgi:broad specificity phosphatase PhoE
VPDHLIVIRAGATDYDLQERIRGTLDMPLSMEGVAAATRAGQRLAADPPAAIYASADETAEETARIIGSACRMKPKHLPNLGNVDMGLWQGRLVEEIHDTQPRLHRQWQDNPWSVAPPEGELLEEACERVEAAIEKIFKRHPGGTVAVVVPRPLDAIVTWLVSGRSMGDLWRFDAAADLVDVLPVAAQWQPPRPGVAIAPASRMESAPSQPFVSR